MMARKKSIGEGKTGKKSCSFFYSFNRASLACCISTSLRETPMVFINLLGSLEMHIFTKGKNTKEYEMHLLCLFL